jgi:recombination endonuclease VII
MTCALPECGKEFSPVPARGSRREKKYCSPACAQRGCSRTWRSNNPDKQRQSTKNWQANHPERVRIHSRTQSCGRYGISIEEFEIRRTAQGNCCGLCGQEFTSIPHIDHDHATKNVRALLCHNCNVGIGNFRESQELLQRAIDYLKRHDSCG